jgi:hypothetical protein
MMEYVYKDKQPPTKEEKAAKKLGCGAEPYSTQEGR